MLKKEDFAVIQALSDRGVYQKDIAAQLGVHPKTVSRALRRGGAPKQERKRTGQFGLSAASGPAGMYAEAVFLETDMGNSIHGQSYGYAYSITPLAGELHMTATYSFVIYSSTHGWWTNE